MGYIRGDKFSKSEHINDKLYMARMAQHYSQEDVARLAGITRAYYTKIENGQVRCSVNMYHRLGVVLAYSKWKDFIPSNFQVDDNYGVFVLKNRERERALAVKSK